MNKITPINGVTLAIILFCSWKYSGDEEDFSRQKWNRAEDAHKQCMGLNRWETVIKDYFINKIQVIM